jgi:DNA-directed RNA polymerase subunit RPC12/RpoP
MPIRFRCAYCNQLLGIARRKAGTVVRCPNCAGQVVVPGAEADQPDEPAEQGPAGSERATVRSASPPPPPEPAPAKGPAAPAKPGEPIFERSDFDKLLNPAGASPAEAPAGAPAAAVAGTVRSSVNEAGINVERVRPNEPIPTLEPMAPIPGIWLSPAKATLLSVLAVLALTVAFVVGLLVGLSIGRTPREGSGLPPHPHWAAR